jgi:hypothetical protein
MQESHPKMRSRARNFFTPDRSASAANNAAGEMDFQKNSNPL